MRLRYLLAVVIIALLLTLSAIRGVAQQSVPVRVDRWLNVQQITGSVLFQQGNTSRAARIGDRLQVIGDGVSTGPGSTATLAVDTGIGFVSVSENTRVRVESLDVAADNGHITRLEVPRGQVRLQIRRFTHRGSLLEIRTPAGVSGVRGTEFGINVHPDGKTGVATLSGDVATSAQRQTVEVGAGFQNLTIPGQAPLPAVPLRDSTDLQYTIEYVLEGSTRKVLLVGQVDPVNTVLVDNTPQITDADGRFSVLFRATSRLRVEATVITPLGKRQVYELAIL